MQHHFLRFDGENTENYPKLPGYINLSGALNRWFINKRWDSHKNVPKICLFIKIHSCKIVGVYLMKEMILCLWRVS